MFSVRDPGSAHDTRVSVEHLVYSLALGFALVVLPLIPLSVLILAQRDIPSLIPVQAEFVNSPSLDSSVTVPRPLPGSSRPSRLTIPSPSTGLLNQGAHPLT